MKTKLLFSTVLMTIALSAFAQKPNPFNAKTAVLDKINVAFDFPPEGRNDKNGDGYSANVELLNPKPKRVALISYYLYDPAKGKTTKIGGYASANVWRTPEDVGSAHVLGMYNKSIEGMVNEFKQNGMELLVPEQYLNTQEKMDFYWGFSQESAKKEKTSVTKRVSATSSSSQTIGNYVYTTTTTNTATASVEVLKVSPASYREFFVANEEADKSLPEHFKTGGIFSANRKMTSSLGYELCKGLDVDAVVVVYIVTRKLKKNKDDYGVNALNMFMFGPNPYSEGSEDKNRGQFYCGSRIFYGSPLVFHNSKTNTPDYSGFDNAMIALSKKTCNWVINKERK